MKRKFAFLACLILMISCDDYLGNDFFMFLFNSKSINVTGYCSDSPSVFSEGSFFEVYSMHNVDVKSTVRNIFDTPNFIKSIKYPTYKIPKWQITPAVNDNVYSFIHEEINTCFNESTLINILKQKGNYYTFLYDNLERKKLFIWDVEEEKLYLITSYEG